MLGVMYQTFRLTQQSGVMALEAHCDDPNGSAIFAFPKFLANHHAVDFFTDSVRVIIMGGVSPYDLEAMMDLDLEVHHHEALKPAQALAKVGDALPGIGIVAAVLGVVITMGAIDGPPSEIGHKVAAALVGTFLGILLCYGFVGPMATSIEHNVDFEGQYLASIKCGVLALSKGLAPAIAVEFARRSIPAELRPTFSETEATAARRRATRTPRRHEPGRAAHHHQEEEGRSRRPPRRRLEGGLRRLRDRDDGLLPRHVAGRAEQGSQERGRRLLPRSRHLRPGQVGRPDRRRRSQD